MKTVLICLLTLFCSFSCQSDDKIDLPTGMDYKQEMRNFVQNISSYSKSIKPGFIVIPQNGVELVSSTGDEDGWPDMNYLNAIDGLGQESLNYGFLGDNLETPTVETQWMKHFLDMAKNNGNIRILVTDYCSTHSKMDHSYALNSANDYISFAAGQRELDNIPAHPSPIFNENSENISSLHQSKNFLYLITPDNQFNNSQEFVNAVKNTNYDLIIIDFFYINEEFTANQINDLKQKSNGGKRLLICYLSIGQAEVYRYYWQNNWSTGYPSFIGDEDPDWPGNYFVRYWEPEWQNIIFGNENSYLKKILDAGFDGVYLDRIDAFEQF